MSQLHTISLWSGPRFQGFDWWRFQAWQKCQIRDSYVHVTNETAIIQFTLISTSVNKTYLWKCFQFFQNIFYCIALYIYFVQVNATYVTVLPLSICMYFKVPEKNTVNGSKQFLKQQIQTRNINNFHLIPLLDTVAISSRFAS